MAFFCLKAAIPYRLSEPSFFLSLIYRKDLLGIAAAADSGAIIQLVRDKTV